MTLPDLTSLIPPLAQLAHTVCRLVMDIRAAGPVVRKKPDGSVVTDADTGAETLIEQELATLTPGVPVIGEEAAMKGRRWPSSPRFWLVDPLDGTGPYIQGTDEFCVSLGLVDSGHPVLGVIAAPTTKYTLLGIAGQGLWESRDGSLPRPVIPEPAADHTPILGITSNIRSSEKLVPSLWQGREIRWTRLFSALKFIDMARGRADIYPRKAGLNAWDTAGGHALLKAVGGNIVTEDGQPLTYSTDRLDNPPFVALGPALYREFRAHGEAA